MAKPIQIIGRNLTHITREDLAGMTRGLILQFSGIDPRRDPEGLTERQARMNRRQLARAMAIVAVVLGEFARIFGEDDAITEGIINELHISMRQASGLDPIPDDDDQDDGDDAT